jgi:hypothetical protein
MLRLRGLRVDDDEFNKYVRRAMEAFRPLAARAALESSTRKFSTNGRQMALSSRDENVKTMLGAELLPITSDRP